VKKLLIAAVVLVLLCAGCKPRKTPSIIELGFHSCGHCTEMKAILDQVESEYKGRVKVVFYDISTPKGKELELLYDAKSVPTVIFFDEYGNVYFKSTGSLLKEQVEAILKSHGIKQ